MDAIILSLTVSAFGFILLIFLVASGKLNPIIHHTCRYNRQSDKYLIDIEYVEDLQKRRQAINSIPLHKIIVLKEGEIVDIKKEVIDEWRMIGLNNIDFIESFSKDTPDFMQKIDMKRLEHGKSVI